MNLLVHTSRAILTAALFAQCSSSAADGLFIAVGGGGRVMTSSDGLTWEKAQEWDAKWADDSNLLHYATTGLGKLVAVGGGGWSRETQAGHILVSNDGKAWHEAAKFPNRVSPVLFLGDRFVAAGGGPSALLWSTDGEKWNVGATQADWRAVREAAGANKLTGINYRRGAAGNGIFLFTGDAGGKVSWGLTTRDGTKIESFATDLPPVTDVAFGAGRFVISGRDGIFTSGDARKWTRAENSPADELWRVVWSGREFVTSGKKGLYRSADGLKWESFGKKPPGWIAVACPRGLVAMSWGANLFFSPDGMTWTRVTQPEPARQMERVIFAETKP